MTTIKYRPSPLLSLRFPRACRLLTTFMLVALSSLLLAAPASNAATAQTSRPGGADSRKETSTLGEIVVTAQKYRQTELSVPISMSVLTSHALISSRSFRLQDFVGKVPGVILLDGADNSGPALMMRGMKDPVNSTVAIYIDNTPLSAPGMFISSGGGADIDTYDMQRIEVLKGPQGTLYGLDSLGGLLKYVTNPPELGAFHMSAEVGPSFVIGGGTGQDARAMVNIPVAAGAAVRVVGYDNFYGGFISDPSRDRSDINGARILGGRVAFLLAPSTDLSFIATAMYQERKSSNPDFEEVQPGTLVPVHGDLVAESFIDQPSVRILRVLSLTAKYNAGFAEILSTTSYTNYSLSSAIDQSNFFEGIVSAVFKQNYGVAERLNAPASAMTEELRVTSTRQERLKWMLGGYFTSDNGHEQSSLWPIDLSTRAILYGFNTLGGVSNISDPAHYRESAGFAHLEYNVTRNFGVLVGGRYSTNTQSYHETGSGLLGGAANFETKSSEQVSTYDGGLRWHVSGESMLYFRVAEGYAPGGPNIALAPNVPETYSSSTDTDYEAGLKTHLFGGKGDLEADAFHISWRSLQIGVFQGGVFYTTNAGAAQSDGIEAAFTGRPASGLVLTASGAYTKARLTGAVPSGRPGDRLPGSPLWEAAASVEYDRQIGEKYNIFGGADWRFTGERFSSYGTSGQKLPAFNITDLRVGIGALHWRLTCYVKNVTDARAINNLITETFRPNGPLQAYLQAPRTGGISLQVDF